MIDAPRTVGAAATELRTLKDRKKALEADVKGINDRIYQVEVGELPALLEAQDQASAKVEGVGTVYITHELFAYVRKDDEEKFHQWLRDEGFGDLIRPQVHPGTLKAWVKERLENALAVPEFVQVTFQDQARIRKA